MNDFELESKLKGVCVPERSDEYWNDFPSRIRVRLHREQAGFAPRQVWRTRLTWVSNFALTAVVLLVCMQYHPLRSATTAIIKRERCFHAQIARLDGGLHRLMLNTDGMGYLLMDAD